MTVMDRNTNPNVLNEANKFPLSDLCNQNESAQIRSSIPNIDSRKNSITGSINLGSNGIPASNLSLSSTSSSASSSIHNSKLDSPTSKFYTPSKSFGSVNSSRHNSNKHDSSASPEGSRRPSGNSITIKIITENNDTIWDESIKESDVNTFDEEDVEREREFQKDRDEEEDTTSNSTANEYSPGGHGKQKRLKERKQLMRSSVQQQHHLTYQESEDFVEEQPKFHELNQSKNLNSAFDELFAAAESGNSSVSAMIEAKMAAEAAAAIQNEPESGLRKTPSFRNNSGIKRSGGSFRQPKANEEANYSQATLNDNYSTPMNKLTNNLKSDGYLGSPKQLTRSCSCKRPSSFKKMRSKNASPNRTPVNQEPNFVNTSAPSWDITPPDTTSRRGTQFSITENSGRRTSSLPFEGFILQQQQHSPVTPNDEQTEIYRVRQFITTKGSVINRGDSFKRSFKRSNQSISSNSKKDISPTYQDTNTLNLPEYQDGGFISKSANGSNYGINETSFTTNFDVNPIKLNTNETEESTQIQNVPPIVVQSHDTYIVYVLGSSTVGKNALIKQFKTSEYRGIYEISPSNQNEEEIDEGVSVMLDGIESKLQFVSMDIDMIRPNSLAEITKDNDAFIIVYSICDKSSFNTAYEILKSIRSSELKSQPVILVGNKSDLVRKRSINREDGRCLALKYGSKFVETSVAINDRIDDLLAGILKQIRLKEIIDKENTRNDGNIQFVVSQLQSGQNKKHSRHLSDAQLNDIVKKSNGSNPSTAWYKSNTLTRKFFKSTRNRELLRSDSENSKNSTRIILSSASTNKSEHLSMHNNNSFFHKIFNTIFKKKSSNSDKQSVENLFTLPITLKSAKGKEKIV